MPSKVVRNCEEMPRRNFAWCSSFPAELSIRSPAYGPCNALIMLRTQTDGLSVLVGSLLGLQYPWGLRHNMSKGEWLPNLLWTAIALWPNSLNPCRVTPLEGQKIWVLCELHRKIKVRGDHSVNPYRLGFDLHSSRP